jgi:PAS domain S-box-containing protein
MDIEFNPYINQKVLFEWIVNSTDDAIISKDLNGSILTWNKAAEKIFGYTQDEILHKNISILIPEELLFEDLLLIKKIKADQIVDHYETRRLKKDGNLIDVSITLSPIKDKTGKIIGTSKILRDITEKKTAELLLIKTNTQLNKSLLDLENQNNKLKEIAWTQSHLVRAPLSKIMGLVSVLQKGLLSSEDQSKYLFHINESTKELDNVIRVITSKTAL